MDKTLKYQQYLDKYKNCPPKDCQERDFECFRWVHKKHTENDFLPPPLMNYNPPRKLDDADTTCDHFCLSVYKDLVSSKEAYRSLFKRLSNKKEELGDNFKRNVGDNSAQLKIYKQDGISDLPNTKTGHFSFHPYEDCKLLEKVIGIFDNFA